MHIYPLILSSNSYYVVQRSLLVDLKFITGPFDLLDANLKHSMDKGMVTSAADLWDLQTKPNQIMHI